MGGATLKLYTLENKCSTKWNIIIYLELETFLQQSHRTKQHHYITTEVEKSKIFETGKK